MTPHTAACLAAGKALPFLYLKASFLSWVEIAQGEQLLATGWKVRGSWPSSLRRGSAVDRFLNLRVRIPPGAWIFVLFVISEDKKAKWRTIRTKDQSMDDVEYLSRAVLGPTQIL
jgi:hypothetical protein